jgi:hypothetical protein
MIGWVILALALGDLVVLALLLKERRAHGKSRKALDYWRRAAWRETRRGVTLGASDAEMDAHMRDLRGRKTDRIRLAQPGGAA